jgi:hypothetical protein
MATGNGNWNPISHLQKLDERVDMSACEKERTWMMWNEMKVEHGGELVKLHVEGRCKRSYGFLIKLIAWAVLSYHSLCLVLSCSKLGFPATRRVTHVPACQHRFTMANGVHSWDYKVCSHKNRQTLKPLHPPSTEAKLSRCLARYVHTKCSATARHMNSIENLAMCLYAWPYCLWKGTITKETFGISFWAGKIRKYSFAKWVHKSVWIEESSRK